MAIKISGVTVLDNNQNFNVTGTISATKFIGDGSGLTNTQPLIPITDDSSTATDLYITFVTNTAPTVTGLSISKTNKLLTFRPSTGNLVVGGTVTASSDKKLKKNIKTIDNALEKVISLRGVEYDRIDTGDHQIGVIAQEVEEVLPEVVYPKGPAPDYETKSVAYGNIIGLLIEAIKEQNIRIEELERRLGDN